MKYPKQLSHGTNNIVIALSETEVAKLFTDDTRSDISSEADKLQYANGINNLLPKFIRLDIDADDVAMLVMERIHPIDYRSRTIEERVAIFEVFEQELTELHNAGFVHRDIIRPSGLDGEYYDNVLLTNEGIKLIDVGISIIASATNEKLFKAYLQQELKELEKFKQYFLSR